MEDIVYMRGGYYNVLYCSVESLNTLLSGYRLYWIIDFITETTDDLLQNYKSILTEREIMVCRKLSNSKFQKAMKSQPIPIPVMKRKVSQALYETFKICRKLSIEDKAVVVENFNLNRIENDTK